MNGQVECKQGDDQFDKKCRDGKLCVIQVTRAEVIGCPHKYRIPIGCIWNTPIKTHRVSRAETPSEVPGISRGGGKAWFFSRHAEV